MIGYDDDKLIDDVSAPIFKKVDGDMPVAALPEVERTVACVIAAQGVIDNGGLVHFFANDWPDQPQYSLFVDAYRAIGVDQVAEGIAATVSAFGFVDPHLNQAARQAWLEKHGDEAALAMWQGEALDQSEAVWSCLAQYIREHMNELASA